MAYTSTFSMALGASKAGLTLAAQILDTGGNAVGGEIAAGFVEVGSGTYMLTASIPDDQRGSIKVYESGTTGTVLAVAAINPEEIEYLGIVEGTVTFRQWVRRVSAVLFGKSSGGGAVGSKKFRNLGDSVNRVDATTDAYGNRTSVTFDDT